MSKRSYNLLATCVVDVLTAALAAGLVGLAAASAAAQSYTFTNIADSNGEFDSFGSPSINAAGTVAFHAYLDTLNSQGIFTGSGGATTPVASTTGTTSLFFPRVSINDAGTVAYRLVFFNSDTGGIFTGSGGATTPIANTGGGFSNFELGAPSINNAGTVAFLDKLPAGGSGVFTGSGGPIATIADTTGPFSVFGPGPSINAGGTVAFKATRDTGGDGIFTGSGGATTPIAQPSGMIRNFPSLPTINDAGTVAFTADSGDGVYDGVFTGSGGAITIIVDQTGFSPGSGELFGFPGIPSINAAGTVVFNALVFNAGSGLFTGDDPVADKVIQEGHMLFGSTISQLSHGSASINDNGDIAFLYQLTSGVGGIAVARPESGGLPGDYNQNGVVDAADYTLWRDNLGSGDSLPNDDSPGVGLDDYTRWSSRFGTVSPGIGAGSGAALPSAVPLSAAVPEPATLCLALMGAVMFAARRTVP